MAESNSGSELDYPNIFIEGRGVVYPGRLKLRSADIAFKNMKTGNSERFASEELQSAIWMCRARGFCLRLQMKDGKSWRFDGFVESDFDNIAKFLQNNYNLELKKVEMSYKGWNWGSVKFTGDCMDFLVEDKTAFEIPLTNVSDASHSKNELVLAFHGNDDAEIGLSEMRFYIPQVEGGDNLSETAYNKIMKKADIIQVTGNAIVEFKDMQCVQPRGRYELKLFSTFFHLHGKTFDYKVSYSTLQRMFLLAHPDQALKYLVLNLDPPLKHGQTRYQSIIFNFDIDSEIRVELRLTEEEMNKKYQGAFTSNSLFGVEFEVISHLFKVFSGRRIIGEGSFESKLFPGAHAISCGYKAQTGLLYPLERSFLFIPRPGFNVRHEEIKNIHFSRGENTLKTFDLEIETLSGLVYNFSSIPKGEYHRLYDFIAKKNLRIRNIDDGSANGPLKGADSWESSSESDIDAYKERVKQEGRSRAAADKAASKSRQVEQDDDEDDSDNEEEDADFNPDAEKQSDVDEEYDSEASYHSSSSEGHSDGSAKKKKKPKKRPAKESSEEQSGGSSSEEEEKRPAKKKAKEAPATQTKARKAPTKKAGKDPNAPKRPSTAFMVFMNQNRGQIKNDLGSGASIGDIGKAAGERWNKLSKEEKDVYNKQVAEAKVKYEEEMTAYRAKINRGEVPAASTSTKPVKKTKAATTSSPVKSGNFKSQEYVESSDGSLSSIEESD